MLFLKTLGISVSISTLGFYNFIYFITISYGFSIATIGVFLLYKTNINLTLVEIFLSILYIVYGLRLALFLLIRDIKNKTYKQKMSNELDKGNHMRFLYKIFIWLSVALLYACQASPLTFRTISNVKDDNLVYVGIIIMIFGFLLEIKADREKAAAKKINPKRFVDFGLYKIVRCPNYLGEVIFWTGNLIGGLKILEGGFQWFIAIFGYILIIYIMFSGARRIEIRQNQSYGKDPIYQKYVKNTPILIPNLPLYSLEKYTWLKA